MNLRQSGFTLAEVMVVVVIIGILSSIAIPAFNKFRENAQGTRFANDLRTFRDGVELFAMETVNLPSNPPSGTIPPILQGYFPEERFTGPTPLGGSWDIEINANSVTLAVGAHFQGGKMPAEDRLVVVDAILDDGDIDTGMLRMIANDRYYWVIYN
jgi:prepilin-type N-terminal cleavage/methylation domain-containing protein